MKIKFLCITSFFVLWCNSSPAHNTGSGRSHDLYHSHDDDESGQDNSEVSSGGIKKDNKDHGYKEIHTAELRALLNKDKNVVVVDARPSDPKENKIPGSKSIPYNAKDEVIKGILTNKDAKIVVYCYSSECSLSTELATRLVKLGYSNVMKFPEGVEGWKKDKP